MLCEAILLWPVLSLLPWDLRDGACSVEVSVKFLHFFKFYFKSSIITRIVD